MTLRQYVQCLLCGKKHTLRIAIGHGSRQEHTVHCAECGEEFTVALDLDQENAGWEFHCVSNCDLASSGDVVVNLHPEFLIPQEFKNVDFVSPNILAMQAMMADEERMNIDTSDVEYEKARQRFKKDYGVEDEWADLRKCWSQLNKGNSKRASDICESYCRVYADIGDSPESWIFQFALRVISPGRFFLFDGAVKRVVEAIEKDESRTDEFLEFHSGELFKTNLKNILLYSIGSFLRILIILPIFWLQI